MYTWGTIPGGAAALILALIYFDNNDILRDNATTTDQPVRVCQQTLMTSPENGDRQLNATDRGATERSLVYCRVTPTANTAHATLYPETSGQ